MIAQFKSRQFIAFLLTGGVAALVNFTSRIVYNHWVGFSIAVIFAYLTGMLTAFLLAKCFVFKDSQQTLSHSIFYFALVNIAAIVQTWLISIGLAYYLLPALNIKHYANEIAHAAGVIFPVFSSYLGHKHWSFKS